MSKEYTEALEPSVVLKFIDDLLKRYENKTDYNIYITKDWLLEIKQSLQRLESIDNANPSEALEETLRDIAYDLENDDNPFLRDRYYGLLDLKQALLKAQKDRKALEIIKEKKVNIGVFYHVVFILKASYDGCKASNKTVLYNICDVKKEFLTEEEFSLLKEMLE